MILITLSFRIIYLINFFKLYSITIHYNNLISSKMVIKNNYIFG
ncbi:hypothetical protein ND00_00580 [Clostridium sp. L74]|nr:hypothetical protein ND00_00580 [Clostridium sp. L74]